MYRSFLWLQLRMAIDPTMVSLTYSVATAKLFYGIMKESVVFVGIKTLYTMVAVRVKKIYIPPYRSRPEPLASLAAFDGNTTSKKFMKNIRQYNCLFAFTSMGAHIDNSLNDGRGPPIFKICGQVHHCIGSLLPPEDGTPKFIRLYIYDTTNEVKNRIECLGSDDGPKGSLDRSVVGALMKMLDDHNPFV
jgi:hypothetical protein